MLIPFKPSRRYSESTIPPFVGVVSALWNLVRDRQHGEGHLRNPYGIKLNMQSKCAQRAGANRRPSSSAAIVAILHSRGIGRC
jgi:hypothetical protein